MSSFALVVLLRALGVQLADDQLAQTTIEKGLKQAWDKAARDKGAEPERGAARWRKAAELLDVQLVVEQVLHAPVFRQKAFQSPDYKRLSNHTSQAGSIEMETQIFYANSREMPTLHLYRDIDGKWTARDGVVKPAKHTRLAFVAEAQYHWIRRDLVASVKTLRAGGQLGEELRAIQAEIVEADVEVELEDNVVGGKSKRGGNRRGKASLAETRRADQELFATQQRLDALEALQEKERVWHMEEKAESAVAARTRSNTKPRVETVEVGGPPTRRASSKINSKEVLSPQRNVDINGSDEEANASVRSTPTNQSFPYSPQHVYDNYRCKQIVPASPQVAYHGDSETYSEDLSDGESVMRIQDEIRGPPRNKAMVARFTPGLDAGIDVPQPSYTQAMTFRTRAPIPTMAKVEQTELTEYIYQLEDWISLYGTVSVSEIWSVLPRGVRGALTAIWADRLSEDVMQSSRSTPMWMEKLKFVSKAFFPMSKTGRLDIRMDANGMFDIPHFEALTRTMNEVTPAYSDREWRNMIERALDDVRFKNLEMALGRPSGVSSPASRIKQILVFMYQSNAFTSRLPSQEQLLRGVSRGGARAGEEDRMAKRTRFEIPGSRVDKITPAADQNSVTPVSGLTGIQQGDKGYMGSNFNPNYHQERRARNGACIDFQRNNCQRGDKCRYAHEDAQKPTSAGNTPPKNADTANKQQYIPPAVESTPRINNGAERAARGTCFAFQRNGRCNLGDGCRFSHELNGKAPGANPN